MSCDLDGEAAVLHMPSGVYFGLDEVGARIWRLLEREIRVEEIERALVAEYEVDAGACAEDVCRLLEEMRDAGIVEIVDDNGSRPDVP